MSFDPVVVLSNTPELSTDLKSNSNPTFESSGTNLLAATKFRNKTWNAAAGLREVSAPLASLPPEIQFGDDFPEPIRYDSTRRLLLYRGFMSNTSYVELQKLSRNLDYARALEQIFTASAIDPAEQKKPAVWLVAGVIGIALLAVAGMVWRMMG